jgi:hypothetical protein
VLAWRDHFRNWPQEDVYKKMFEAVAAKQMKDLEAFFVK